METLFSKLTNLGYEIFGVILPGIFAAVLLGLLYFALGGAVEVWSYSYLPAASMDLLNKVDGLSGASRFAFESGLAVLVYFLGHALNWISRGRSGHAEVEGWRRVALFLRFRFPKPKNPYDEKLKPLFDAAAAKLYPASLLTWREIYPVAKALVNQRGKYSLVATYQNKYTFHRAITAAWVGLFWLCLISLLAGAVTRGFIAAGFTTHWVEIALLGAASLIAVRGFSSSYLYNWTLFGDSLVAESYLLLCGPALPKEEKAEG